MGTEGLLVEAMHNDSGKARWDLAPWRAFGGVIDVLTYGCKKYAERNWEGGMRYSRLFASCMRHMLQWWHRNDMDPESGLHHLKHAATNLCMLVEYIEKGMEHYDDRPSGAGSGEVAGKGGEGVGVNSRTFGFGSESLHYGPAGGQPNSTVECTHWGHRDYDIFGQPHCADCGAKI